MKYIKLPSTDIYSNLAYEEYIFTNLTDDDYILLWTNSPSIVFGRHQNPFEELNLKKAELEGVKTARRITGGGTVFHDAGNLNYSFIRACPADGAMNWDDFLNPVISALNSIGVPAKKQRRSDIGIEGMKISGSAQRLKNNRLLHHGTLLFSSDLDSLRACLKTTDASIQSKAVKSAPSPVTNISGYLDGGIGINEFKSLLLASFFPGGIEYGSLPDGAQDEISALARDKYASWDWIYGRSPKFELHRQSDFENRRLDVRLVVDKGIIKSCGCEGAFFGKYIEPALTGLPYGYKSVMEALRLIGLGDLDYSELADCFF